MYAADFENSRSFVCAGARDDGSGLGLEQHAYQQRLESLSHLISVYEKTAQPKRHAEVLDRIDAFEKEFGNGSHVEKFRTRVFTKMGIKKSDTENKRRAAQRTELSIVDEDRKEIMELSTTQIAEIEAAIDSEDLEKMLKVQQEIPNNSCLNAAIDLRLCGGQSKSAGSTQNLFTLTGNAIVKVGTILGGIFTSTATT